MTLQQIGKVWVTLSLILVYYALNSWIVSQGGNEVFGTKLIVSDRVPAALIAIGVCSVLLLVASLVGRAYARRSDGPGWGGRIPVVGFDSLDARTTEGRIFQGAMLLLLSILPAASLAHFWWTVLGARIVTTGNPPVPIDGIWDWSHFGWDDPARICTTFSAAPVSCEHNATVLPGLEPTVLAFLTLAGGASMAAHLVAIARPSRRRVEPPMVA